MELEMEMDNKVVVDSIMEEEGILTFTLSGVNVSLANAIRRIILSEIPTVVFRTTPYEKNKVNIEINTSRMNNEIIKQRFSCIPIYLKNDDDSVDGEEKKQKNLDINDYVIEVDVKNDTKQYKYVTTQDFKIKNRIIGRYLSSEERDKIFPPDNITNEYIQVVRLRPRMNMNMMEEQLKLTATLDYGMSKDDGSFNVVSTCTYSYAQTDDKELLEQKWKEKEEQIKKNNINMSDEEFEKTKTFLRKDWELLDAKRIIKEDNFNYVVESVGPYSNKEIVYKACKIMIQKLNKMKEDINIKYDEIVIHNTNNTINNCYDILLINEDYTLGKVIEYMLYNYYFKSANKEVTYCGFSKPHPHIEKSIIRVGLRDNNIKLKNIIDNCVDMSIVIYKEIASKFT